MLAKKDSCKIQESRFFAMLSISFQSIETPFIEIDDQNKV